MGSAARPALDRGAQAGLQLTVCCIRKRLCHLKKINPCQGGSLTDMCCTEIPRLGILSPCADSSTGSAACEVAKLMAPPW